MVGCVMGVHITLYWTYGLIQCDVGLFGNIEEVSVLYGHFN